MRAAVGLLVCAVAVAVACGDEPCFHDILHEHRAELVACEPGDECVVPAEDADCACFGSYNARQQELWDSLRSESRCEGCPQGFCPAQVNPRCQDGECVSENMGPVATVAASRAVPGCAAPGAHSPAR